MEVKTSGLCSNPQHTLALRHEADVEMMGGMDCDFGDDRPLLLGDRPPLKGEKTFRLKTIPCWSTSTIASGTL